MLATPYTPGQGTPDAAGTVEAESVVPFPRSASSRRPTREAHARPPTFHPRRHARPGRCSGRRSRLFAAPLPRRPPPPSRSRSPLRSAPAPRRCSSKAKRQVIFLKVRGAITGSTVPCTPDVRRHMPLRRVARRGRDDQQYSSGHHLRRSRRSSGGLGSCVSSPSRHGPSVGPGVFADAVRDAGHELVEWPVQLERPGRPRAPTR